MAARGHDADCGLLRVGHHPYRHHRARLRLCRHAPSTQRLEPHADLVGDLRPARALASSRLRELDDPSLEIQRIAFTSSRLVRSESGAKRRCVPSSHARHPSTPSALRQDGVWREATMGPTRTRRARWPKPRPGALSGSSHVDSAARRRRTNGRRLERGPKGRSPPETLDNWASRLRHVEHCRYNYGIPERFRRLQLRQALRRRSGLAQPPSAASAPRRRCVGARFCGRRRAAVAPGLQTA